MKGRKAFFLGIVLWMASLISCTAASARNTCSIGIGPAMDTIPRNAAFLLETCGCEGEFLAGITRDFPAYLVSDGQDTVPMRLIHYFKVGQEQALIGPGRYLRAGETYHLHIPELQEAVALDWPMGLSWKATSSISESRVGFYASPKVDSLAMDSSGNARIVVANLRFMPLDSMEFYWVMITATDTWSGVEFRWIQGLAPRQTNMVAGDPSRTCGPAPVFGLQNDFEVVLTLLGVDGDEGRSSDPVRIGP